ncbi:12305_t:CDS:2, partial [Acaulospora colombiana]
NNECFFNSDLHVKLVNDLSLAREQTQQFSSSAFISEAHECQQLEAGHLWMQPVKYMDFELGESSDTVVFGTEKGTEIMTTVLNTILEGKLPFSNLQIDQVPRRKKMIELERQFQVTGPVSETLSTLEDSQLGALLGEEVKSIMVTISDKWDFESHSPLPKRVVRTYMGGEGWKTWGKAQELVDPSRKDSY